MAEIPFRFAGAALWQRMERADQRIRERLNRTVHALEQADIPYAVIGEQAVRSWVIKTDESAERGTRDVEILLRRADFSAAKNVLEAVGFVYRHDESIDMFLDGADAKARDAVHVIFAGERVRSDDSFPAPDVTEVEHIDNHRTLSLAALVLMKLNAFRDKDRMHLRDMLDVELIDATWCERLPPVLAARLQELLDNPDG